MEDSVKGLYTTITLIGLFIVCIMSFIYLFVSEQGYTFAGADNVTLTLITNQASLDLNGSLSTTNARSDSGFRDWDITEGFMGSNTIKQSSLGILDYIRLIFTSLTSIATSAFGANSPVVTVIGVLLALSLGVAIYFFIAWVRSGK